MTKEERRRQAAMQRAARIKTMKVAVVGAFLLAVSMSVFVALKG